MSISTVAKLRAGTYEGMLPPFVNKLGFAGTNVSLPSLRYRLEISGCLKNCLAIPDAPFTSSSSSQIA